jgi:hypothetical protein
MIFKTVKFLLISLLLSGCAYHNHYLDRYDKDGEQQVQTRRHKNLFSKTSFWVIADAIKENAQPVNTKLTRAGTITYTTRQTRSKYSFVWEYISEDSWTLNVFYKGKKELILSLKKNSHGLTYQHIFNQNFVQSSEKQTWDKINKTKDWRQHLELIHNLLQAPQFDPSLNWLEEEDGLKYYIITFIDNSDLHPLKHQLYLHKSRKTIARHIKTSTEADIYDTRYNNYNHVGSAYLANKIKVNFPLYSKNILIEVDRNSLNTIPVKSKQLKKL